MKARLCLISGKIYFSAAFLSYVNADDQYQRISELRKRLSDEVRMQTGDEFPIFQNRLDIAWGQNRDERINKAIGEEVTFCIPIITPSFFKSKTCRYNVAYADFGDTAQEIDAFFAQNNTPNANKNTPNTKRNAPIPIWDIPFFNWDIPNTKRDTPTANRDTPNGGRDVPIGVKSKQSGGKEITPPETRQTADNNNAAANQGAVIISKGTLMPTDYLPSKDLQLAQWLANFLIIAQANEPALGLTAYDLAPITSDQTEFTNALTGIHAAKLGVTAAVKTKVNAHKIMTANVRAIVKKIQSNKNVSDTLKSQLGITASTGVRTNTPPVMPTTLVATPLASGVNTLAWKRMGNKPNTQYVVYSKPITSAVSLDAETGWTMVGQTTRSRFDHKGVTPGQPLAYKIVAARAEQTSSPTAPVTVYTS